MVCVPQLWDSEFLGLYKTIIDQSADGLVVVLPQNGQIVYANQRTCKSLDYSYDELTQLKIWDIAGNIPNETTWRTVLQHGRDVKTWFLETFHKTRSGKRIPVEIHARLLESNGQQFVVSSIRDISERMQFQAQLAEEHSKLDAVMATIEDGITVQDPQFRVLYQNKVHKQKQGDQKGRLCYVAYQGREEICEGCLVQKTLEDGAPHKRETVATTKAGKIYMEVTSSPIKNEEGKIISVVEAVRDVTSQKMAEETLRESARLRGDMLTTAAHEFRTPLTTILGYAELLLSDINTEMFDNEKHSEFLQEIISKAESLSKTVDQFLDMSRIEKGRLPLLEKKTVQLDQVLGAMIKAQQLLFSDYRFNLLLPTSDPLVMDVDPLKFQQVMENVLTNSVKYSASGTTIQVEVSTQSDGMTIDISDEGVGMTAEQVERIFEPFYRADPENYKYRGLGLGMSLAKHVIEAHKGNIKVASRIGEGTTVSIWLPR